MEYTVQQHGEWSGREDVLDLDFEAETLEEAWKIVAEEIPSGVIYLIIRESDGRVVEEGTKR